MDKVCHIFGFVGCKYRWAENTLAARWHQQGVHLVRAGAQRWADGGIYNPCSKLCPRLQCNRYLLFGGFCLPAASCSDIRSREISREKALNQIKKPPEGGFFTFLFYSETTRQEASISKKPLCPVKLTLVYSIYTVAFSV